MGREIRRVPPNWSHPRDEKGQYIPLLDEDYDTAATTWTARFLAWENGTDPDRAATDVRWFWDWDGGPPDQASYRPTWTEEPTWYQMYEDVSEGTPVTPPFPTEEALIEHLVQHGTDWDSTPWRREAAESFVRRGWAPSFIVVPGVGMFGANDQDLVLGS